MGIDMNYFNLFPFLNFKGRNRERARKRAPIHCSIPKHTQWLWLNTGARNPAWSHFLVTGTPECQLSQQSLRVHTSRSWFRGWIANRGPPVQHGSIFTGVFIPRLNDLPCLVSEVSSNIPRTNDKETRFLNFDFFPHSETWSTLHPC